MAKRLSFLKLAALTLALCGLTASAAKMVRSSGYLSVVGPAPLRFQPPTDDRLPLWLPPLIPASNHQAQATAENTNAPAPGYAPLLPDSEAGSGTNTQTPADLNLPPIVSRNTTPPEASLVPQNILGYLVPVSTNALDGQLQVPMFVPPQAPQTPSSHATYESR